MNRKLSAILFRPQWVNELVWVQGTVRSNGGTGRRDRQTENGWMDTLCKINLPWKLQTHTWILSRYWQFITFNGPNIYIYSSKITKHINIQSHVNPEHITDNLWGCKMASIHTNYSTHCGLMTPYGDKYLGQNWIRKWVVAWRQWAITWTYVDMLSVRSSEGNSTKKPQPSITELSSLKITFQKFHLILPGAND